MLISMDQDAYALEILGDAVDGRIGSQWAGDEITVTFGMRTPDTVRFIVEAVNSHAELKARVRELEAVLGNLRDQVDDWAESEDSDGHSEIVNWDEMYAARVALNKGEGE